MTSRRSEGSVAAPAMDEEHGRHDWWRNSSGIAGFVREKFSRGTHPRELHRPRTDDPLSPTALSNMPGSFRPRPRSLSLFRCFFLSLSFLFFRFVT
jgi:hypothetical protein